MSDYLVTLAIKFKITAENIAQARKLAKSLKVIGERVGAKILPNNRDAIRFKIVKIHEEMKIHIYEYY